MLRYAAWIVSGALPLQILATLPSAITMACVAATACGCAFRPRLRPFACMAGGMTIMWLVAAATLDGRLSPSFAGRDVTLTLRVADFRQRTGDAIRFEAVPVAQPQLPGRVRISWYDAGQEPAPGDTWTLRVRLRRPRGLSNEGAFDFERYLHRRHIGATGYVVSHPDNQRLARASAWSVDRLRNAAAARITRVLPDDPARAVLLAIAVGARGDISSEQWQRYARTGTSHLMAISGLHIGLAAAGSLLVSWALLALLTKRRNVHQLAMVFALLAAGSYALLSGWAVPAQRACVMLALGIAAFLLRRRVSLAHIVGSAALLVFLSDPLSLYSPGFLLSFAAVLWLSWRACRLPAVGLRGRRVAVALRELAGLQLVLLFGLMPLTVALFGRVSLLAPAINLIALPMFNFVTVPCALVGLLLSGPLEPAGNLLLGLSWRSIDGLHVLLESADALPYVSVQPALSGATALSIAVVSLLCALLPAGFPGRGAGIIALLVTALYRPSPVPPGCFDLTIFDVGQGLAAAIRTRGYTLLYDSGPAYRGGASAAPYAIEPWLRRHAVQRVDTLMVSHDDLDHAGGVSWLRSRLPVDEQLAGEPRAGDTPCRSGQSWMRDGIRFDVLHPVTGWRDNNASCVLSVSAGQQRVLLPGDVEAQAERRLLRETVSLAADLVVVPHHGSRTSSGGDFVSAVSARYAVVSAGYGNRWGFPKPDVVSRWRDSGATLLSTGDVGAVSARYCADAPLPRLRLERETRRRYWHD